LLEVASHDTWYREAEGEEAVGCGFEKCHTIFGLHRRCGHLVDIDLAKHVYESRHFPSSF
jgi:hypothetical protein